VAIVAGGSRNIGAAIARLFAAEGATVVIGDLREDEGRALADEISEPATFARLDVTDEESWARVVDWTEKRFGPVSVLVNNAAIIPFALELGQHGIRVNSVHPGKIDVIKERDVRAVGISPDAATAPIRVPLGRSGAPVDVARLALFLASDESSYATGAEFVLDGGWTSGFRLDFFGQ
jgi:NAD(P)-dependent dehydrogenase (short-subunit alcohol dehydrogenase family)